MSAQDEDNLPRPEPPDAWWPRTVGDDEPLFGDRAGPPRRARASRRALAWLRFCLHVTPLPTCAFAAAAVDRFFGVPIDSLLIGFAVVFLLMSVACGGFDALLAGAGAKAGSRPRGPGLFGHVITFLEVQFTLSFVLAIPTALVLTIISENF